MAADGIDNTGSNRRVRGQRGDGSGHRQPVEMAVRRRIDRGEIGKLRRPDRIRPKADQMIGHPDRMKAPGVEIGEYREIDRKRGADIARWLEWHLRSPASLVDRFWHPFFHNATVHVHYVGAMGKGNS